MPPRHSAVPALLLCALFAQPAHPGEVQALPGSAAATPGPALAPVPSETSSGRLTAAAGTELVFEMLDAVDSKSNQRGDRFQLRLAEPLRLDGKLLIPAGAVASGDVVHADRAKAGGQAGELILAARYLEWDGRQLPLGGFRAGVGRDRTKAALGVATAAGPFGFLVRGGQIEMPAGSLISARLREATELAILPEPEAPPGPIAPETPAAPDTEEDTHNTPGEHQQ